MFAREFSLPEVITRYELPVDIELVAGNEAGSVPAAKLPKTLLRVSSVAIAKSVVGFVFEPKTKKMRQVELSPATQVKLSIPK